MFGSGRGSAIAVAEEVAITRLSAQRGSGQDLRVFLRVTGPVRRAACDSCVPFHGDSQIARHPRAERRRRRSGCSPRLALGAHRLRSIGDDLDTSGVAGADGGQKNCRPRRERSCHRAGRGGRPGRGDVRAFCGRRRSPGGALWSTHPPSPRRFLGARGGRRDLVHVAARRGLWLRPAFVERAFVAFSPFSGVLRVRVPPGSAEKTVNLAQFSIMLPLSRPGDSSSP